MISSFLTVSAFDGAAHFHLPLQWLIAKLLQKVFMIDADGPIFHYDRRDADRSILFTRLKYRIKIPHFKKGFEIGKVLIDVDELVFDLIVIEVSFKIDAIRTQITSVYF